LRFASTRYEILIFLTGAATLSLEVLASRIMTPYFGVSLYIWSGILSITLAFLAIGYQIGGKLTQTWSRRAVEYAFLGAPIVSAIFITLSTLLYPLLFPWLSQVNLIVGSFVGASVILALPLIALSAMNPLLISLQASEQGAGDGGAGRVFFISTMGSVTGVLATAFLFIPNVTNFRGTLMLCTGLGLTSLIYLWGARHLDQDHKRHLFIAAAIAIIISLVPMVEKDKYLNFISAQRISSSITIERSYKIVAEYTSMFGNIKIAEVQNADGTGEVEKQLIHDGLVQNRTRLDNSSLTEYTDVLEELVQLYAPEARDVLVLGLGAGIVPRKLASAGKKVSVVEINDVTLMAAIEHFGFEEDKASVFIEDARTYARACSGQFDALVVDLFLGDNVPDYLTTKEFFGDLRACLRADGALVMNAFFDSENSVPNGRLLATIATAFPDISISGASSGNVYLAGTTGQEFAHWSEKGDEPVTDLSFFSSRSSQRVNPALYQDLAPITDEHNIFSLLFSDANMAMRQYLAGELPPHILVN